MKKSLYPLLLAGGVILLLTLLMGLQYRWLIQATEAERERLQRRTETETAHIAEDFNREIKAAYFAFQIPSEDWKGRDWREFNERYEVWKQLGSHSDLVRGFLFVDKTGPALEYNSEKRDFEILNDTSEFENLTSSLRSSDKNETVINEPLSLIVPVGEIKKGFVQYVFSGKEPRPPLNTIKPEVSGYMVILLDQKAIIEKIFPELEAKYFPDGEFKIAVVDQSDSVIYQSAEGGNGSDASAQLFDLSPDNVVFFASRAYFAADKKETPDSNAILNERIERKELEGGDPAIKSTGTVKIELESSNSVNKSTSMILDTRPAKTLWSLNVYHRAGSVNDFIAAEQNRRFLIGAGVYTLLVGAIIAIGFSSMRAKQFARRQIEFVSSVSHEFRTPISVIQTAGENLADGLATDSEQIEKYGKLLKNEGKKLSAMVEQILEYAGAHSDRRFYHFQETLVNELLRAAVDECSDEIAAAGVEIELEISENLGLISVDPAGFCGALQNLIRNSIKYSGGDGKITISAERHGARVLIRVKDNGIGIPPDELKHVFDPFFRGREVIDSQIHGNGLGLSIVKQIVEAHGGRVFAESEIGKGSIFTVEMPMK